MKKKYLRKKEDFERKERFKKIDKKKEHLRSKTVQTKIRFGLILEKLVDKNGMKSLKEKE